MHCLIISTNFIKTNFKNTKDKYVCITSCLYNNKIIIATNSDANDPQIKDAVLEVSREVLEKDLIMKK